MSYLGKYRIIRVLFYLIPGAEKRTRLLKKSNYFYEMGDNIHFQPRILPADPKFIKLHNNISVASNVSFINHDIIHLVFNQLPNNTNSFASHLGCIEIMDNVFIGAGSKIMPGVKIGPNAIVAAGSIVTKDVEPGTIVGGVPAKVIGDFDILFEKRKKEAVLAANRDRYARIADEWEKFDEAHNKDNHSNLK